MGTGNLGAADGRWRRGAMQARLGRMWGHAGAHVRTPANADADAEAEVYLYQIVAR